MTGPEHYREAELSLETAAKCIDGTVTLMTAEQAYAEAQVHATLALAAATALNLPHPEGGYTVPDWEAWIDAASAYKRPHKLDGES
jgi:hypothetical protein